MPGLSGDGRGALLGKPVPLPFATAKKYTHNKNRKTSPAYMLFIVPGKESGCSGRLSEVGCMKDV